VTLRIHRDRADPTNSAARSPANELAPGRWHTSSSHGLRSKREPMCRRAAEGSGSSNADPASGHVLDEDSESAPAELETIANLSKLASTLRGRRYSEADIAGVMGQNWIGLLEERLLHPQG